MEHLKNHKDQIYLVEFAHIKFPGQFYFEVYKRVPSVARTIGKLKVVDRHHIIAYNGVDYQKALDEFDRLSEEYDGNTSGYKE